MRRIQAACILQTMIFTQREDFCLSYVDTLATNRMELARYKRNLNRKHIRYQIVSTDEQPDGSIIVRIRKQFNDKMDVDEYFDKP